MRARLSLALILLMALAAIILVAAGCGGSSKPAYCSNVSALQSSVDELKSVQLQSGFLSTLRADVQKVENNARAVVSSAKADFPSQTSALESAASDLTATIQQLPPSPTAKQLLPLAPEISSLLTAAQNLRNATGSACD